MSFFGGEKCGRIDFACCSWLFPRDVVAFIAQEIQAKRWSPGHCEEKRDEESDGHGDGESAEEGGGETGDRDEGKKDNEVSDGRADEWDCHLAEGAGDAVKTI